MLTHEKIRTNRRSDIAKARHLRGQLLAHCIPLHFLKELLAEIALGMPEAEVEGDSADFFPHVSESVANTSA